MLKKNLTLCVTITDMNNLGYGIAKADGLVIFVSGGVTGDESQIKIIKVAKDYAVAITEKLLKPSEHRTDPLCPVFKRCGGCAFRHITRAYELELKKQFVQSAFRKCRVDAAVNDVLTDGRIDGYRNKVQYPVNENGDYGYYARHSHDIVCYDSCSLSDPSFEPILKFVSDYIKRSGTKVRHIYLRRGEMTGETMLCLVTKTDSVKDSDSFVREAVTRFPEIKSIVLSIKNDDSNVILGKTVKVLYGEDLIHDVLCSCTFGISALSFYQVNRGTAELLYNEAIKRALRGSPKKVADLYCGAGTIGISLAKAAPEVSVAGVEIIPDAVENAKRNAEINGIKNAEFICADAMTAPLDGFDVIITDPPRKGMSPELVKRLCEVKPKKIVYVSCEPSTLARDAAMLIEAGYKMSPVTPVDMFARTGSVESVTDFII